MTTELEKKEVERAEQEQQRKDFETQREDRCPVCGAFTSTYPYSEFNPFLGWLECVTCGVVFAPLSIRRKKIERATKLVKVPKLLYPPNMTLCQDCAKKPHCTTLCPEAELYANQDEVPQRELTIGLPLYSKNPEDLDEATCKKILDNFFQKTRKEQVDLLLNAGWSRIEIAQLLGITRNAVRMAIKKLKIKDPI